MYDARFADMSKQDLVPCTLKSGLLGREEVVSSSDHGLSPDGGKEGVGSKDIRKPFSKDRDVVSRWRYAFSPERYNEGLFRKAYKSRCLRKGKTHPFCIMFVQPGRYEEDFVLIKKNGSAHSQPDGQPLTCRP